MYVSMSACLGKNDIDSAGNNTFTNNVEYDIYNNRKSDIYAIMNKLDGTAYDEIGDMIYDCNDDAEHGKVFYTPWVMPKSTLVFMASVNGVLGVGVDITINDTTITTGEDGKVSITLSNGEYNYFYSYNNITSDSIAFTLSGDRSVKVVITEAALEQYEDASISIYQNPVTKQICISGEQEINDLEIYNLSGRLIYGVQSHGQGCQQNISLYDMASESMVRVRVRVKISKGITTQKSLLH